jgi:hypothetical protein
MIKHSSGLEIEMRIRITKYNPIYRNSSGHYLKDEWTCSSEIGRCFNGKTLTLEEYVKMEEAYILTIKKVLHALSVEYLSISNLEICGLHGSMLPCDTSILISENINDIPEELQESTMANLSGLKIVNGSTVKSDEVGRFFRLVMRNVFWCKLVSKNNTFIHIADDYYVYMGSGRKPKFDEIDIPKGIYVEYYHSPYLEADL